MDDDPFDPNFFNTSNPTLDDIPMNNNNNNNNNNNRPTRLSQQNHHSNLSNRNPTNLSINSNNVPHQNYHGLGILQRGQQSSNFYGHFSNPLSQQNYHGLGILLQGYGSNEQFHTTLSQQNHQSVVQHGHGSNIGNVPFNSNAMPQQNDHGIQHGRSGGSYDPFIYNLVSPENDHGIQHGRGGNYDPFNYNLISPENDHGIQQGQDGNNDIFSHAMSQQNHPGIQHGHGSTNETFSLPVVQNQLGQQNNNVSFGINNFEVGGSSRMNENQQQTEVLALDQWPPEQQQNSCSGCQVLREIIHSNG